MGMTVVLREYICNNCYDRSIGAPTPEKWELIPEGWKWIRELKDNKFMERLLCPHCQKSGKN